MESLLLAHDLGTTGNKATLFTAGGEMLKSVTRPYGVRFSPGGRAEQNPEDWWEAVCATTRELLREFNPRQVKAVSFSGQMMGIVCVDKQGGLLRDAIIWADTRSTEQEAQLRRAMDPGEFYQICGHRPSASYSLTKLMWVRDNEPDTFSRIHKVLHAKDYIVLKLTGEFLSEYSDASGTNAFDIRALAWSDKILAAAQIDPSLFPDVFPSTHVAGTVTRAASALCGLPEGIPVVIGGGDGVCASVGAGSVTEGAAYNYMGSSSWICVASREPVFDPEMRTFNWVHMVPGYYAPCGTMQAAGNSMQYARDLFCHQQKMEAKEQGVSAYGLIDKLAEQSPVGANGLLFLPYLLGERSPWWNPDAKGSLIGLTMSHTQSDVMRAVEEGILLNLGIILECLQRQVEIRSINVIGGLARGAIVRRMAADIFGTEICKLRHLEEATSMGAAITAGVGAGILKDFSAVGQFIEVEERLQPDSAAREEYKRIMELFKSAYHALEPLYSRLKG